MKEKVVFMCTNCGNEFSKWAGQCEACKEWNTLKEVKFTQAPKNTSARTAHKIEQSVQNKKSPIKPTQNTSENSTRYTTNIGEFDRVLGGGFFPGSAVLLTGDPGIGKSTLSLHASISLAKNNPNKKVIVISGEESEQQISDRIFRLTESVPSNFFLLSESIIEHAIDSLPELNEVGFLVFDSVQTLSSRDITASPGAISQVVAVTEKILSLAKSNNIPVLIIGHVTKSGEMAGPQTLAHLVDTVIHFEGTDFSEYRMLRANKNRFGSVFEIGVFEMNETGLHEVSNPSKSFLSGRMENAMGSSVFTALEGARTILMEVQALTKYTSFGNPQRSTSGFPGNRLSILLAVLQRFTSTKLDSEDVFVNVVGGLKITEPAADLAVIASLISSKKKVTLPQDTIFCGEVGLSGEIRQVSHIKKRIQEAEKLGFKKAIIPKQKKKIESKLDLIEVQSVGELERIISL